MFELVGADAIHPERVLTDPQRIGGWRRRGALVSVWTVNDPTEAADLAACGVDGILSDEPGRILDALETRAVRG